MWRLRQIGRDRKDTRRNREEEDSRVLFQNKLVTERSGIGGGAKAASHVTRLCSNGRRPADGGWRWSRRWREAGFAEASRPMSPAIRTHLNQHFASRKDTLRRATAVPPGPLLAVSLARPPLTPQFEQTGRKCFCRRPKLVGFCKLSCFS